MFCVYRRIRNYYSFLRFPMSVAFIYILRKTRVAFRIYISTKHSIKNLFWKLYNLIANILVKFFPVCRRPCCHVNTRAVLDTVADVWAGHMAGWVTGSLVGHYPWKWYQIYVCSLIHTYIHTCIIYTWLDTHMYTYVLVYSCWHNHHSMHDGTVYVQIIICQYD